jgi:hypothetical protein
MVKIVFCCPGDRHNYIHDGQERGFSRVLPKDNAPAK